MMKLLAKKFVFDVKPYVPGRPMEEVKRELGLEEVIKLASNENPGGPSPAVLKAIKEAASSVNRYPDSHCYTLRAALAKRLGVSVQQLIFGNGSDEILVMATRAFLHPGDEVVLAKPSFLIYEIASRLEGAVLKEVPLKDFRYDLGLMKKSVTARTKLIFLGNPDNPSGSYFTQKEMATFLQGLPNHVIVILDEAYFEYVLADDYVDSIGLMARHPQVLVTRTFSKLYGLAGLRIGYGIGDKELIDILNRVREPFNVNSIAQAAAVACLKDQAYYGKLAKEIAEAREWYAAQLKSLGLRTVKSSTNFLLIDVNQPAKPIADKLLKEGVIVRDMTVWGLERFIRVTIGTKEENRIFIRTLKKLIK